MRECSEVRRSAAPLASAGELELIGSSRSHRLCAVTRSDSGAWGRVLQAVMQPEFGTSTVKHKLHRAVRKQRMVAQLWTVDEFAKKLVASQIKAAGVGSPASALPPPPPPPAARLSRATTAPDLHAQIRAARRSGSTPLRKVFSVPGLSVESEWRHACDCPQNFMDCELCKSHFGPPRAPAFAAGLPGKISLMCSLQLENGDGDGNVCCTDGCELLESIRYNARNKEAKVAWPWPPYSEMAEYARATQEVPRPGAEGQVAGRGAGDAAADLPPWAPFSPPFTARAPMGMGLVEGLQWRNAQEKAMRVHGIKKQQVRLGSFASFGPTICWTQT
jgi:hypothetical protein